MYHSISLNGAWEMQYREDRYTDTRNPFDDITPMEDPVGTEPEDISNNVIENAVPRYWVSRTSLMLIMALLVFVKSAYSIAYCGGRARLSIIGPSHSSLAAS